MEDGQIFWRVNIVCWYNLLEFKEKVYYDNIIALI
jgi:hypothetical protein